MEPQQQNTPVTPIQPDVSVQPQTSVPQTTEPVTQMPQAMPQNPPISEEGSTKKKMSLPMPNKKLVVAVLGGILVIVILIIVVVVLSKITGVGGILPDVIPSPVETSSAEVKPASPYANDPEVLKIKEDLDTFDHEIDNTELREDTLRIPVLEWSVDFKK